jgi:hypothetical protein
MTANAASSTAISAIAQSAGTVTVTAAGHALTSGDLVSIDGVADYTYTGLVTVNVTNANVFTYSRTTTNASSSGGYVTKLQGTWASYSGGTGPSYRGGPGVIEANSRMPALRVTQTGGGYAFIVEDAANPDTSAFIIANDGSLSINTNKFTVDAATGNTTIGGTLTLTGGINLNGNVTVGDASTDTLTINSTITSNLIFTDNTYDIGASGATRPRNLYLAGTATIGGNTAVTGTLSATGTVSGTGTNTWNIQSVGTSGSLVAGGWFYGVNEGLNLSPNGAGLLKRLTISYFTGSAYAEALGISNVNTGTGTLSLMNGVASVTSTGLAVTGTLSVTYPASTKAGAVFGTGATTQQGWSLGNVASATSGIWSTADTPSTTNYRLWADANYTIQNGPTYSALAVAASNVLTATSTSLYTASTINVGIGTSSPANKLTVKPSGTSSGTLDVLTGSTNTDSVRISGGGTVNTWLEMRGYLGVKLYSDSTNTVTVDASGNLGLGVTPSNWSGWGNPIFQLSGAGTIVSNTSITYLGANFYYNGGYKYIAASAASYYLQNAGSHAWYRSTSTPSIGADPVFSAAMTLDASGNLLVGTTSNLGSAGRTQSEQTAQSSAGLSVDATNASFDYKVAYLNTTRAASSVFDFIQCTSGGYGIVQFRVRGDGVIYAQNTTVQSLSDVRTKENIRDATDGLQVILGLQPRRFDFKQGFGNGRKNALGFVAQEIEAVFPDAVSEIHLDPDSKDVAYKTVGPAELIPVLVKAIQELTARITALEGA